MMKQCLLKHDQSLQTAWIPSYAAVVGKHVELKEDGLFWEVMSAFNPAIDDQYIKQFERNFKDHRKATDV